ncbi:MAG: TM2 domain-containing protein [Liquorilactobacillus hordei]|uniref:TM2 domain-containing protein n=1 Tax=Liquorilactobacillus hordei TaxID=468911 RepID=UPI0039E9510B
MNNTYLLSQLTNEERLLVNSEIEKRKKNTVVAYLLWFFLGTVGGHRYYFGKTGSAIAMTLITVLTLGFGAIITAIWAIVDVFLINGWLREDQDRIENGLSQELLSRRNNTSTNNESVVNSDSVQDK